VRTKRVVALLLLIVSPTACAGPHVVPHAKAPAQTVHDGAISSNNSPGDLQGPLVLRAALKTTLSTTQAQQFQEKVARAGLGTATELEAVGGGWVLLVQAAKAADLPSIRQSLQSMAAVDHVEPS
jgi:hypothetical protein